jgi:hypothetical protein
MTGEKPVVTEVAGFEFGPSCIVLGPVVTSMAVFAPDEPVVTKVAAFARDFSPQLPGNRIVTPARRR